MSLLPIPTGMKIQSFEMETATSAKKTVADLDATLITPTTGRSPQYVLMQATTGAFRFGTSTDPVDGSVGLRLVAAGPSDCVLIGRDDLQALEFIRDGGADSIVCFAYLV